MCCASRLGGSSGAEKWVNVGNYRACLTWGVGRKDDTFFWCALRVYRVFFGKKTNKKKMRACSDYSCVVSKLDGDLCTWFCPGPSKALYLLVFSK